MSDAAYVRNCLKAEGRGVRVGTSAVQFARDSIQTMLCTWSLTAATCKIIGSGIG